MGLLRRRDPLPAHVRSALGRERSLALARDDRLGDHVVATPAHLVVVAEDRVRLRRGWHEVAAGSWEPMTETISVVWVDGARAAQWTFAEGGPRFAEVFYERVAASVVIDLELEEEGRVLGRAAIRRDLAGGGLVPQLVWERGVRVDARRRALADGILAELGEQAGLDPAALAADPAGPNRAAPADD